MLAVVNFPEYQEDEQMENVEKEIDALFDYMDERIEADTNHRDMLLAMAIVLKLVTENDGTLETVH